MDTSPIIFFVVLQHQKEEATKYPENYFGKKKFLENTDTHEKTQTKNAFQLKPLIKTVKMLSSFFPTQPFTIERCYG